MAKLLGHDICTREEFTEFVESKHNVLHCDVGYIKTQMLSQSDEIAELKTKIALQTKLVGILLITMAGLIAAAAMLL